MKKQYLFLMFALLVTSSTLVQAACGNGRCGMHKERVQKERKNNCSTGSCGRR